MSSLPPDSEDIWAEIYAVQDMATRLSLIYMYRMILRMQNADQIAEIVASKVRRDRVFSWNIWQKAIAGFAGLIVVAESIKNLLGL